jgi:hypothetical protein
MNSKRIIKETTIASTILILLVGFGVILILSQFLFYDNKPENFGEIGDAVGGILGPVIAIAGVLLTFLAFYIQKLANDELKTQFSEQRIKEHEDFLFKNYKDRIMLIINEINTFNISFHGGTLISGVDLLNDKAAKKYNFIGIQAINLFLIEYFNLKEKRRSEGNDKLILEESYHAIFIHISNLITGYYNAHIAIEQSNLEESPKTELLELLSFTYYTKFYYFFEYLKKKHLPKKLKSHIDHLYEYYKTEQS